MGAADDDRDAKDRGYSPEEEESFRRSIIARAAEGLCVCHAIEQYPHVRFTIWNPRMCEITGYSLEEINQSGWYQTVYTSPEVSRRAQERMERMREGDDLIGEEWEIARKDGQLRVLSISTSVLLTHDGLAHVLGLMQDVTDRRQAEDLLRRSEARYRATFERAPIGIVHFDHDGRLTSLNARYAQMLGYSVEELLGGQMRDLTHPDDAGAGAAQVAKLLSGEQSLVCWEERQIRKDRSIVWVRATVGLLQEPTLALPSAIAVVEDTTPLRLAEQERRRLEVQVQHSQKLESLGVLAGGIAHDFNNLLCGVLGNADLALLDLDPEAPARPYIVSLKETARQAAELCRQMLAYSGKGRFVVEPLDLSQVIGGMRQLLEISVSKQALLRPMLAPGLPAIEADASQLRQIILNLVINASEALGASGGTISVSTGTIDCDRDCLGDTYFHEQLAEGRYVFLEVADTGCGMDRQTLARIFDPFFTTKFSGRGLGLAATLGIVRGHHGAIKIHTEVGQGTTFKVLLPCSTRPASRDAAERETPVWVGDGLALVVDDEPTVRSVTTKMLERMGFEVLVASDGESAVALFRQHAARIVLVLLDMTMPGLSGEATFRELRRLNGGALVILTSGYNEPDATSRFAGHGLAGFLPKPFTYAELRDRIVAILSAK
jgi:PAS domain S-box-containing protein